LELYLVFDALLSLVSFADFLVMALRRDDLEKFTVERKVRRFISLRMLLSWSLLPAWVMAALMKEGLLALVCWVRFVASISTAKEGDGIISGMRCLAVKGLCFAKPCEDSSSLRHVSGYSCNDVFTDTGCV